ncbi:MAG: chromosomal replication initiator protein DnaA [Proteobacteria bacterium]|nr:chromosomal replication initiator protein DnaA [Pseudomonadota bacterium]
MRSGFVRSDRFEGTEGVLSHMGFMNAELWARFRERLQNHTRTDVFEDYLSHLTCRHMDAERWELCLPNASICHWVEANATEPILMVVRELCGDDVHLDLSVLAQAPKSFCEPGSRCLPFGDSAVRIQDVSECEEVCSNFVYSNSARRFSQSAAHRSPSRLNPVFTFDNFVKGDCNEFAYAAAKAVSANPADAYNPLFLYGGVGLGKTHLMHAIGNEIAPTGLRVHYMTGEEFTNDLIESIQKQTQEAFRDRMRRSYDVLLIDDIQFIANKNATQNEFFHTFNHLQSAHCQIVLASDKPPQEIAGLEERLRSRFNGGLICDIQLPDYETRLAILNKKAASEGIFLPDDVADYIASKATTNVRELEGYFMRIKAYADLNHMGVSKHLAVKIIDPLIKTRAVIVDPSTLIKRICTYYNVKEADIMGSSRVKSIVHPRHVAMYLLRAHTDMSFPVLGKFFNRDHTTIMNAYNGIVTGRQTNATLDWEIKKLEEELK